MTQNRAIASAKKFLKKNSIKIYDGMINVSPEFEYEEELDISEWVPEFNGYYAIDNSTICFVLDNEVFVTPYTSITLDYLKLVGLYEHDFYVLFSYGDYPKYEREEWLDLCKRANKFREDNS